MRHPRRCFFFSFCFCGGLMTTLIAASNTAFTFFRSNRQSKVVSYKQCSIKNKSSQPSGNKQKCLCIFSKENVGGKKVRIRWKQGYLRHRQVKNRGQKYLGRQILKLVLIGINLNGKLKGLDLVLKIREGNVPRLFNEQLH